MDAKPEPFLPLRVELASNERVLISNACIRNVGSLKVDFIVETRTKLLRGKYLITEDEADTLCKRLHLAIERLYLADEPSEHGHAASALSDEIASRIPSAAPYLACIDERLTAGDVYRALKHSRDLVDHETALARNPSDRPHEGAPCRSA